MALDFDLDFNLGSSTEVSASCVVRKVLEDFNNPLPGIVAGAVVTDGQVLSAVNDYLSNGMYSKAESYYKYGVSDFIRGVPKAYLWRSDINSQEIVRIISGLVNKKIIIHYALQNSKSNEHMIRQYLQDTREMDSITLVVGNVPTGLISEPVTDFTFTGHTVNESLLSTELHYTYVGSDLVTRDYSETYVFPFSNERIYQVQYQEINSELNPVGMYYYWYYQTGEGTYPVLDLAYGRKLDDEGLQLYPILPLYEDLEQICDPANKGTPLYDSSKKLAKRLGMDYVQLYDSISPGLGESIGEDKGLYAHLLMGVQCTAGILKNHLTATEEEKTAEFKKHQAEISYLIDYFNLASESQDGSKEEFIEEVAGNVRHDDTKFKILVENEDYIMYLQFRYIDVNYKTGVIGKLGWCDVSFESDSVFLNTNIKPPAPINITTDILIYRRQETESTYIEVEVCGLKQLFKAKDQTGKFTIVGVHPFDYFKEENATTVIVPLVRNIVRKTKYINRNELVQSSMHFVFTAYQITEIEWYQQPGWSIIIYFIAIVTALPSGGSSLKLAALFTAAGLTAAGYAILLAVVRYLIFKEFAKYVAKELGAEAAFILSIVLMAYGKFSSGTSLPGAPFAHQFLLAGSSIWSATNTKIQNDLVEIEKDYAKLKSDADKYQADIERAEKLLEGPDSILDIDTFLNTLPTLNFGQSAESFINERIHVGNPGIYSLESASTYVDLMVRLPTINDTLT